MAVIGQDDFTRADGPMGSGWVNPTSTFGVWEIDTNHVEPTNTGIDSVMLRNAETYPDDHYSQAVWTGTTGGADSDVSGSGLALRGNVGASTLYWIVFNDAATGNCSIARWSGAGPSYSQVAIRTAPVSPGDVIKATIEGQNTSTTIKIFVNGSQVGADIVDNSGSALNGGGVSFPGIAYSAFIAGIAGDRVQLDNWEGGDLAVGGAGEAGPTLIRLIGNRQTW